MTRGPGRRRFDLAGAQVGDVGTRSMAIFCFVSLSMLASSRCSRGSAKRDRHALAPGAADATDAVHVALGADGTS